LSTLFDRSPSACPHTSRPYQGEHDLRQMLDLLMEARSRSDDWRYWHVGELAWTFFMVACHLNPAQHIRLWHDGGGRLLGYALLGEDSFFDWQVLPEYEWGGIEAEALAWAETLLAALRQRDAEPWSGPIVVAARQDNPRRRAFLEQHGFRHGADDRAEVNLLRSLAGSIPTPAVPAGCLVRAITGAENIADRAAIQYDVWYPWSVANVSAEDYTRFMQLPCYEPDLDVVAIAPDGAIAAYVNGWIDPLNRVGDLGPVGARPAYRRQGLTRAVLLECMRRMQARGMDRVCVSTGETNTPARRLYESVGFQPVNRTLDHVQAG